MTTQDTPSSPVLPPLPEPKRFFGHSTKMPMYTGEEMQAYALAAIAGQGDAVDYVLDLLVAAGHISREKAFHARDIAREFHPIAVTAKDAKP